MPTTQRFTVKDVFSTVRGIVHARSQKELLFNDMILAYNASLVDVVQNLGLSKNPTYYSMEAVTIVIGGATIGDSSFDLNTLTTKCESVISIVDATNGKCTEVGAETFLSILNTSGIEHQSFNEDIVWTLIGSVIYFKHGSKLTATAAKRIVFERVPQFPTDYDGTQYVDIPDKFVALLIRRMVSYLLGIIDPTSLTSTIPNEVKSTMEGAMIDLQNRNKLASQTTNRES